MSKARTRIGAKIDADKQRLRAQQAPQRERAVYDTAGRPLNRAARRRKAAS